MVTGLSTTWCQVSDMDKAVAFYRDVLGISVKFTSPYWTQLDVGNGGIGLHPKLQGEEPPLGIRGKGWFLGLETSDVKGLRDKIEELGLPLYGGFHDVPGGVVLDFQDPDGNPIQAIQKGITSKDIG